MTAAILALLALLPDSEDGMEEVRNRVEELIFEARSRNLSRAVFRQPATEGNAWDEYRHGLWFYDDPGFDDSDAGILDDPQSDCATLKEVVSRKQAAIQWVMRGAQRQEGQYPYDWERGRDVESPNRDENIKVARRVAAQARILAAEGRPTEAAALLLDLLVFSRDITANGSLSAEFNGLTVYATALNGLRGLMSSGRLKQQDFSDLAAKLELVDRDYPKLGPTLANQMISHGMAIQGIPADTDFEYWRALLLGGGWHYGRFLRPQGGWRMRSMAAASFKRRDTALERVFKLDALDFAAASKEADALQTENEKDAISTSTLFVDSFITLRQTLEAHLRPLAAIRILRAAALYRATGKMPVLADPFGVDLLAEEQHGKMRIWSAGQLMKLESLAVPLDLRLEIPTKLRDHAAPGPGKTAPCW